MSNDQWPFIGILKPFLVAHTAGCICPTLAFVLLLMSSLVLIISINTFHLKAETVILQFQVLIIKEVRTRTDYVQ